MLGVEIATATSADGGSTVTGILAVLLAPGVVVVDCHFYHRLLPALVRSADVVVLPFVHDWDLFPVLEERRAAGHVTVFEAPGITDRLGECGGDRLVLDPRVFLIPIPRSSSLPRF